MNASLAAYLNPDLPVAAVLDEARGTPQRWGGCRRTFIRTSNDQTVPPALHDRMFAEADEVLSDGCHRSSGATVLNR